MMSAITANCRLFAAGRASWSDESRDPSEPWPVPSSAVRRDRGGKKRRNGAWHISLVQPVGGDLAEARAAGQNIAFQHQPETAGRKGRRDVYQLGEDSWLITYNGRLGGAGHFRVSVARYIGSTG